MAKLIRCTSQKIHLQKYTLEQYTPTSSMTWAILRIILLLQPIDIDKILYWWGSDMSNTTSSVLPYLQLCVF